MNPTEQIRKRLKELRELGEKVDRHVCDLASGKVKWEMCVPPQETDSDMLLVKIPREALPASLDAIEELAGALEDLVECRGIRSEKSDKYGWKHAMADAAEKALAQAAERLEGKGP